MREARPWLRLARCIWARTAVLRRSMRTWGWARMAPRLRLLFETSVAEAVAEEGMVKCSVGCERILDCERSFCWPIYCTTSAHIRPTRNYLDFGLPLPSLVPSIPVCYREKTTSRSPPTRHALSLFAPKHSVTRGRVPDTKTNLVEIAVPSQRTQLYLGNEAAMTASQNPMIFLLPILQSLARALGGGQALLPSQGLPSGFLARDKYTIPVQLECTFNIHMNDLHIDQISVPPRRPR
jgi:hypothetical protein